MLQWTWGADIFSGSCFHFLWINIQYWNWPCGSSSVSFLRYLCIGFCDGCTSWHSHQQCRRGFSFLHIRSCFWWWPFWQVWGGTSLWFWLLFPSWWVMLSIFSCAYWSSVFLLWKNVCLSLLPIVGLDFFFVVVELYELFVYFGN